mmetsp:Transcript_80493/g.118003  ORF Transcript_80493/g.118003 Transcript_80493/m.118003 type:complete len:87 (+) Transcript_80493:81-341(+)
MCCGGSENRLIVLFKNRKYTRHDYMQQDQNTSTPIHLHVKKHTHTHQNARMIDFYHSFTLAIAGKLDTTACERERRELCRHVFRSA